MGASVLVTETPVFYLSNYVISQIYYFLPISVNEGGEQLLLREIQVYPIAKHSRVCYLVREHFAHHRAVQCFVQVNALGCIVTYTKSQATITARQASTIRRDKDYCPSLPIHSKHYLSLSTRPMSFFCKSCLSSGDASCIISVISPESSCIQFSSSLSCASFP